MRLGKQQEMLGPLPVGAPDGAAGSWLWLGPALAIAALWGLNQQMEDASSLCHSTFQTNK